MTDGPEPRSEAQAEARLTAVLRSAGSVFAEDEARLLMADGRTGDDLATMVRLRCQGVPLEQVLGWAEFCGLRITVEPGVFVPRRRTELLAREALRSAQQAAGAADQDPVVVELCCGTAAVAAVLQARADRAELYAADLDEAAVRCARRNLRPPGRVLHGDLYDALPPSLLQRVDVLVANAPYVPSEQIRLMPSEARDHEPAVALDGGADGLDVARRIIEDGPRWLAPGGHLLVETSQHQAPRLVEAFTRAGLAATTVVDSGIGATVVRGVGGGVT